MFIWEVSIGGKETFYRFQDGKLSIGIFVDWIDFSVATKRNDFFGLISAVGNYSINALSAFLIALELLFCLISFLISC